ncbi:unnamed protein product [Trichobilharzia regenti]|nr:unnamed protein product [Trichobilharzia regenti]
MEATLLWGHLAPTCPDTLPGYPMIDNDPLLFHSSYSTEFSNNISHDYPDIYIAGCQPETTPSWRHNSGALLVSVPRFDASYSIVLINLRSLECRVVRIDLSLLDE